MNSIEKLIEELCPQGVEYKELGEVGIFIRGTGLQKKDFTESGIGCIHYGQIYTHYGDTATKTISFVSEKLSKKLRKAKKNDLIIASVSENIEDVCKAVVWLGEEDICISGDSIIFRHNQNPKFIGYLFQTEEFLIFKTKYAQGAKVTRLRSGSLPKFQIPVPPLPIQEAIVNILDKFTTLEAELEAELEARKSQYEYYRNELLTPIEKDGKWWLNGVEVEWKTLGEITLNTQNINWKDSEDNSFEYIDLSSVNRENNKIEETLLIDKDNAPSRAQQIVEKDDVLFGTTRPTLKRYTIIPNSYHNQICSTGYCVLRANTNIALPKFLFFSLTTDYFYKLLILNQEGASYPSISNNKIKSFNIPLPPLSEQERIVSILDKFDALVNDIAVGLPAEIEARRKQYEYYRNKLLTFEEQ